MSILEFLLLCQVLSLIYVSIKASVKAENLKPLEIFLFVWAGLWFINALVAVIGTAFTHQVGWLPAIAFLLAVVCTAAAVITHGVERNR